MNESIPYNFLEHLVLRAPLKPINNKLSKDNIDKVFNEPIANEALYLASKNLYEKFTGLKNNTYSDKEINRLYQSLGRYFQRLHNRTTPFGLFAGIGTLKWSPNETNILIDENIIKSARVDMSILCKLADQLTEQFLTKLKLSPNTSLYQSKDNYQFIESQFDGSLNVYQVSSIKKNIYIDYIIELVYNAPLSAEELGENLINQFEDIDLIEAIDFISMLVNEKILVTELDYSVTGQDYLTKILNSLKGLNIEHTPIFKNVENLAKELNLLSISNGFSNDHYKNLSLILDEFNLDIGRDNMIQMDSTLKISEGHVSAELQKSMLKALKILNLLNPVIENTTMNEFKRKFIERYDTRPVMLCEAIDFESGIGYGVAQKDENELTHDLYLFNDNVNLGSSNYDMVKSIKQGFLERAKLLKSKEINLEDVDLSRLKEDWSNLPNSFSIMFRTIVHGKILLDIVGNSSSANLLARFANNTNDIEKILKEISQIEQNLENEALVAEVAHVTSGRIGNIMQRPAFRDFEIPYLANASANETRKIYINDLFIVIKNDELVLFSKSLNKEIQPIISNAHNFDMSNQPLYKFLADFQFKNKRFALNFGWNELAKSNTYLPRVVVGNVVLSPATWNIKGAALKHLYQLKSSSIIEEVSKFLTELEIPECFIYLEFDNELLVDSTNELSITCWLDSVKNKEEITLKEYFEPSSDVKNLNGDVYANQFIASVYRSAPKEVVKHDFCFEEITERTFIPGSKWVYYKIYCGLKSIEKVLTTLFYPICNNLIKEGIINKWFFIRYFDTDHHLRIRFELTDQKYFYEVNRAVYAACHELAGDINYWKIQLDTYEREVERYGSNSIEIVEDIFYYDSVLVTNTILKGNEKRWLWCFKQILKYLNYFEIDIETSILIFESFKKMYYNEFNVKKVNIEHISAKYRKSKAELFEYLKNDNNICVEDEQIAKNCKLLTDQEKNEKLTVNKLELIMSIIHMTTNRIFPDNQRKNELVLYDFLLMYFKSARALKN